MSFTRETPAADRQHSQRRLSLRRLANRAGAGRGTMDGLDSRGGDDAALTNIPKPTSKAAI
jgi:hypothetical protein